jgi:glycosyltransferase involved in cell wall biosynthesis
LDDPKKEDIKIIEKQHKGKKIIIYAGGLRKEKGLVTAIKAMKYVCSKYPDALLLLIGGDKKAKKNIDYISKKFDIYNNVKMLEWMDYKSLQVYLHASKIGIAPYQKHPGHNDLSKGNSRKIFSYMQAKIPVVTSSVGEIHKIIKENKCGLIINGESHRELAAAIIYLLDDPIISIKFGENGRKAFEKKYNWELQENKLLKFFAGMKL